MKPPAFALAVQRALRESSRPMDVPALAEQLGVSKRRIWSRLPDWCKLGYVAAAPGRGLYTCGPVDVMQPRRGRPPRLTDEARYALYQLHHGPLSVAELAELLEDDEGHGNESAERALELLERMQFAVFLKDGRAELTTVGHERAEVE
jgi:hypothetical protein